LATVETGASGPADATTRAQGAERRRCAGLARILQHYLVIRNTCCVHPRVALFTPAAPPLPMNK
jgi:hypothetical protein